MVPSQISYVLILIGLKQKGTMRGVTPGTRRPRFQPHPFHIEDVRFEDKPSTHSSLFNKEIICAMMRSHTPSHTNGAKGGVKWETGDKALGGVLQQDTAGRH